MKTIVLDQILVSLFAALTAIGAFIKIPLPYAPLTLQTLMVMFSGLILGSRLGALSQFLYLTIGLIGLPIFAQGGGPGYVLQPSFGFLVGFSLAAYAIGYVTERNEHLSLSRTLAALLLGQAAMYLVAIPYLYFILNFVVHKKVAFATTVKIGFLVFMPGDLLKTVLVACLAPPMRQRILRMRGRE
jgi:biotin transport system substrate-specific component